MTAERARKLTGDGLLSLLSLDNPSSGLPHIQSLHDFCESRRLSLRSRLELVEHVASLVAAAHDSGSGFLRISSRTVNVEYVDVSDALEGHEIGTDDPWINDLDMGVDGGDWFPPASRNSLISPVVATSKLAPAALSVATTAGCGSGLSA